MQPQTGALPCSEMTLSLQEDCPCCSKEAAGSETGTCSEIMQVFVFVPGFMFHHIVIRDGFLCFFTAEWYSGVFVDHIFFLHSSVARHLCYFHLLALVHRAVMNVGRRCLVDTLFSFGCVPSRGIATSCGSCSLSVFRTPMLISRAKASHSVPGP